MISKILFEEGNHKWVVIGRDPDKPEEIIDTNEYIIINNGEGALLDPGGIAIFPQVLTELTNYVKTENIRLILASHQDPDISSSLAMWLDLCPDVKVYCSWLWTGFIAHFGMGTSLKLLEVPDEGMGLSIGNSSAMIYLVPAHFCHSPGNFSYYDPKSRILFSGDIGAALMPSFDSDLFVKDFNNHVKYMDGFHRRWMSSTEHLRRWVRRVRAIDPIMICPQHGSIFKDENVGKFLDWLESLEVGIWGTGGEDVDFNKCIWMKWKK